MSAYNAGQFIRESIQSLLYQSFNDFELWIVDDGSTDNTKAEIESIHDDRIRKFFFDQNRGRVEVVNELVGKITSEFFTITDADDISHPHRLEKQIELLDKDKTLMMCGTSYTAIDQKGFVIREMNLITEYNKIYTAILKGSKFHGPTTVMRREVLNHFREFYREYFKENMADADLANRIVDRFKAVNLSERLYFYRIVKTSISRRDYTMKFCTLEKIIAFLSEERRETGSDSLDRNDYQKLKYFLNEKSLEFFADPSLIYRRAGFYHLYWRIFDKAWCNALKAWSVKPLRPRNIFLVVYTIALISMHVLSSKRHYRETDAIFS